MAVLNPRDGEGAVSVFIGEMETLALATSACGLYFLIINWAGLRLVVHCVSVY